MSASNHPLGALSACLEPTREVELTKHEARNPVAVFTNSCTAAQLRALAFDLLLNFRALTLCVRCANPLAKLVLALIEGVIIARLSIQGHDSAHGSLSPRKWMNDAIGRFVFLFTATPFRLWQRGHNTIHHGFTNLRGKDTAWTPYSPAQFAALPPYRQFLQRMYRTSLGVALYYTVDLWWKKLFFPSEREVAVSWRSHRLDSLGIVFYFLGLTSAIAIHFHSPASGVSIVLLAVGLPFAVFFWLMGFTITPPHSPFRSPVRQPLGMELCGIPASRYRLYLSSDVGEHPHAQHLRTYGPPPRFTYPLLSPPAAQAAIESALGPHVVIEKFSFHGFRKTLQCCDLYDYDQPLLAQVR